MRENAGFPVSPRSSPGLCKVGSNGKSSPATGRRRSGTTVAGKSSFEFICLRTACVQGEDPGLRQEVAAAVDITAVLGLIGSQAIQRCQQALVIVGVCRHDPCVERLLIHVSCRQTASGAA